MAMYDSAGLLSLWKRKARRPAVDESISDDDIYRYLAMGQEYWLLRIAQVAPEANYGGLVQLTTADNGLTYTFGADPEDPTAFVTPFGHVEVRASKTGRPLLPGVDWDHACDFIFEGDKIRFPGGKARQFSDGPYARFCKRPAPIAADEEPVLKPMEARPLIVARALIEWCSEEGDRDPTPYQDYEKRLWSGDPTDPSDSGILGMLKTQYCFSGAAALPDRAGRWWSGIDDGSSYTRLV